jgi:hypothetical protein
MNYYLLDCINKVNHQYIHRQFNNGELVKITLLNVNFTFTCDIGLNEKYDVFKHTKDIELAPINDKKNRVKKSNRGKKSNKKLEKKMNKFGSNIKFKVYDEEYDQYFTVIVFRINNGGVPGLKYNDDALICRLINKVFDAINEQFPEKNFKYIRHSINLCNLKHHIMLGPLTVYNKRENTKVINIYLLRDIIFIIYNKENDNMLLKEKEIKYIKMINECDNDLIFRNDFIDCVIKDSNVYLVISYKINNKCRTCKVYNNGKIYAIGLKNIMDGYDIVYNIKHIVYRYHAFILS